MRSGSSGRCGSSGGRHTRLQRLGVLAGAARGIQLAEEERRAREGGVGVGAGESFVEELQLEGRRGRGDDGACSGMDGRGEGEVREESGVRERYGPCVVFERRVPVRTE